MSATAVTTCTICTENFKATDTIYSTSCGHVFHHGCLQSWRGRSSECPICRVQYPNMQKLYLTFDEDAVEESKVNELKAKLQSCETRMEKLYDELNQKELDFLQIQEQYTIAQEEIRHLNSEMSKLKDSETNFLALQKQYTEAGDSIKDLTEKNEYLSLQIEGKNREIRLRMLEISTLKDTTSGVETSVSGSDSVLQQKLAIMEQKLGHITAELQKEISISMQLSIDKMKLQSLVDQFGATKMEPSPTIANNIQKSHQTAQGKAMPAGKETIAKDVTHVTSVVLKRFPKRHIRYPLVDIIIAFASAIDVQLSAHDIHDVRLLEKHNVKYRLPNIVSLLVQFKCSRLKTNLLNNSGKVRNHPEYGSVIIHEYRDDYTNTLFHYAKTKLKHCGFCNVVCENGKVMVSQVKKGNNNKPIHVKSTAQVDDMISKNTEGNKENVNKNFIERLRADSSSKSNLSVEEQETAKGESDLKYDEDFYAHYY
uniref:RING-type domain-containing protein n=1 Tax=Glossina pallidipes TaxID=7398 RepID=A0A1A9ZPR3_GLOPL